MSPVLQACPDCRAAVAAGDRYCEECGADLTQAAVVPSPGAEGTTAGAGTAAGSEGAAAGAATAGAGTAAGSEGAAGRAVPGAEGASPGGLVVLVDEPDLVAGPAPCVECGGQVDPDGYCGRCGTPAPLPRDHWLEQPASWVAAVCDRGLRHPHNEDAVAVAAAEGPGSFAALVVCDGVSSSTGSAEASLAAVRAALDVLITAALPGPADPLPADPLPAGLPPAGLPAPLAPVTSSGRARARAGVLAARIVDAGLQANAAVVASAGDPPRPNPPSCTFATAVLEGDLLVAGWAGDSRVYWLPDAGSAVQISSDDSWAGEAIAAGIPRADAERAPQAHAITRWFGVDAPDPRASTAARRVDGSGWVLVCSDGLWNYCSPAAELQGLVAITTKQVGSDPARLASELVAWAKQQGGHDNITVALARVKESGG